jgi:hypothetical protein
MGIANTTAPSALVATMTGLPLRGLLVAAPASTMLPGSTRLPSSNGLGTVVVDGFIATLAAMLAVEPWEGSSAAVVLPILDAASA